ncbi:MAG: metalloregulator ArsR/SmtB family transcription factor [Pseudomonadota bacterium]
MIPAQGGPDIQATFRALADPTRRQIAALLGDEEKTVAQVASQFAMTRAAVKKHLVVMEEGGLVISEHRGRETLNRLEPLALKRAADWLRQFERFWEPRLAALKDAVERDAKSGDKT